MDKVKKECQHLLRPHVLPKKIATKRLMKYESFPPPLLFFNKPFSKGE